MSEDRHDESAPLYFLTDTSGSAARSGFLAGWNLAVPRLLELVEAVDDGAVPVAFLSFATTAHVRAPLIPVRDLSVVPVVAAEGFSSLAAGLRLLADTVARDADQLAADGVVVRPARVLVTCDGPWTDPPDELVAARALLADATEPGPTVHLAAPAGVDALAAAGLGARRHVLDVGDAGRVAASLVEALRAVLRG